MTTVPWTIPVNLIDPPLTWTSPWPKNGGGRTPVRSSHWLTFHYRHNIVIFFYVIFFYLINICFSSQVNFTWLSSWIEWGCVEILWKPFGTLQERQRCHWSKSSTASHIWFQVFVFGVRWSFKNRGRISSTNLSVFIWLVHFPFTSVTSPSFIQYTVIC
jgi:hypothetical protein